MLFEPFKYMEWAKTVPFAGAGWNLGMSGFSWTDPGLLGVDPNAIALDGPNRHGAMSVRARVAARYRVPEDHVLPVAGTSLGIFLLFSAVLEPGDDILIESPTYEALLRAAGHCSGRVNRFERSFADGYRIDSDVVARALTPKTRIVAVCDLHNPSGVAMEPEAGARLKAMASERGFLLFVDEVYRDFLPDEPVGTLYEPGSPVLVASSLTKVYGMGGLRAGWILGPPEILRKARQVQNVLHVNDPWPVVPFIEAAFDHAEELRRRGLEISAAGRAVLSAWMGERTDMSWVAPAGGLCSFPRLPEGLTGTLVSETLHRDEDTLVVPGRFFEDDRHVRIGVAAGPDAVREGLTRLGRTLDRLKAGGRRSASAEN